MFNNLTSHIDYSILSRPSSPIYKLHKYWGRKPWNVIEGYIRNYTKKGDIILDVFSGSGVATIEALKLGDRKVIAIDINPIATFIAKQSVVPVDLQKFENAFENIVSETGSKFGEEYYTICRKCGNRADVIHFKWGRERLPKGVLPEQAERELLGLRYNCPNCKTVVDIPPNEDDRQQAKKDYIWVDKYLNSVNPKPIRKLATTRRSEAGNDYFKLFTPRNLFLLCVLYDAIQKIEDDNIRDIMKLVFTSSLDKSSRLLMYTEKGVAHGGVRSKSWVAPRFHIQRNYLEKNPLINFRNSFSQVFKSKKESNRLITDCRLTESVKDVINGTANVYITNSDVSFLDELPADSIDYAIVDPPFVEDVRYLELSQLWNNWLGIEVDWEREIQLQTRRLDNYSQRLTEAFQKIYRVLKIDKYLTVIYHTEDINLWDIMVKAPTSAGFRLCKLVPQGVRYSYGGKYRALYSKFLEGPFKKKFFLGHYYLTFTRQYECSKESTIGIEEKIIKRAKELIQKRNEPTPLIFFLLNLYEGLTQSELKELSIEKVIEILSKSPELQREQDRSNGQMWEKWTLTDMDDPKMALKEIVKTDLAEMLLFERNRGATYYIQGILNKFKGEQIVSSQRVKNLLDELSSERRYGNLVIRELKHESEITIRKEKQLTENLINLGKNYNFKPDSIPELGVMWEKEDRPLVLFHFLLIKDLIKRLPSVVEKLNQIALDRGGFRRVVVIPKSLKEEFLKSSKEQWDYVIVEDLESFLKDQGFIERAGIREKEEEHLKKKRLMAKVVGKEVFATDSDVRYFKLILETGFIERHALAGQFVNILCHPKKYLDTRTFQSEQQYFDYEQKKREKKQNHAILRRPISIHRIYYEHFDPKTLKSLREIPPDFARRLLHPGNRWRFDILVKVVGLGTKWLSQVKKGDIIDMIGPLGNGFTLNPDIKRALIVGGGIGIAPLYALAERLRWEGKEVILFLGAYEEKDLRILGWDLGVDISYGMEEQDIRWLSEEFKQMDIDVKICTMEGRSGERGLVTEIFKKYLRESKISMAETEVFSCGPRAMLKNLALITKQYKLRHQILLEEVMGCGIGACLSCVCPISTAEGGFKYKRVCTDGPVFDADEVDWDAYKTGS